MKKTVLLVVLCCLASITATAQDKNDAIWKDINGVRDVTLDSLAKANQARPVSGSSKRHTGQWQQRTVGMGIL